MAFFESFKSIGRKLGVISAVVLGGTVATGCVKKGSETEAPGLSQLDKLDGAKTPIKVAEVTRKAVNENLTIQTSGVDPLASYIVDRLPNPVQKAVNRAREIEKNESDDEVLELDEDDLMEIEDEEPSKIVKATTPPPLSNEEAINWMMVGTNTSAETSVFMELDVNEVEYFEDETSDSEGQIMAAEMDELYDDSRTGASQNVATPALITPNYDRPKTQNESRPHLSSAEAGLIYNKTLLGITALGLVGVFAGRRRQRELERALEKDTAEDLAEKEAEQLAMEAKKREEAEQKNAVTPKQGVSSNSSVSIEGGKTVAVDDSWGGFLDDFTEKLEKDRAAKAEAEEDARASRKIDDEYEKWMKIAAEREEKVRKKAEIAQIANEAFAIIESDFQKQEMQKIIQGERNMSKEAFAEIVEADLELGSLEQKMEERKLHLTATKRFIVRLKQMLGRENVVQDSGELPTLSISDLREYLNLNGLKQLNLDSPLADLKQEQRQKNMMMTTLDQYQAGLVNADRAVNDIEAQCRMVDNEYQELTAQLKRLTEEITKSSVMDSERPKKPVHAKVFHFSESKASVSTL